MKNLIIVLFLIGCASHSNAQDVLYEVKLKETQVPKAIIETIKTNYPNFIVKEYKAIPLDYVSEKVFVNNDITSLDDFDTFQVSLREKQGNGLGVLVLLYNREGKLLSTYETLKDEALPYNVEVNIAKEFPGWTIKKDKFKLVQLADKSDSETYKFILEKGKKTMRVYTDKNGMLLNKK